MKTLVAATAFAAALFASSSALAADPTGPVLRVESGQVMASDGGEFMSAQSGTSLDVGDRLMLADGSSASVTYSSGCSTSFQGPGVYAVQGVDACKPAAGSSTVAQGFDGQGAAIIAGAGAVAIGVIASQPQDSSAPPVSR